MDNQLQLQERITTVSSAYHLHIVAAVTVYLTNRITKSKLEKQLQ